MRVRGKGGSGHPTRKKKNPYRRSPRHTQRPRSLEVPAPVDEEFPPHPHRPWVGLPGDGPALRPVEVVTPTRPTRARLASHSCPTHDPLETATETRVEQVLSSPRRVDSPESSIFNNRIHLSPRVSRKESPRDLRRSRRKETGTVPEGTRNHRSGEGRTVETKPHRRGPGGLPTGPQNPTTC